MNDRIYAKPTRGFWIISGLALLWNLLGVVAYLLQVTASPAALNALTEAERSLPVLVTGANAIAVFSGAVAGFALLLRKSWAIPLFMLSLLAVLVQIGATLLLTDAFAVLGAQAAVLPVAIVLISVYLIVFSRSAKRQGYLY
ncbi:MAG: hypothetical protein RIA65_15205 [Woeseia sp.]